jgi:hypothetical protein
MGQGRNEREGSFNNQTNWRELLESDTISKIMGREGAWTRVQIANCQPLRIMLYFYFI